MPFGHPWWEVLYRLTVLMELADAVYKYLCLFWCLSGRLRMLEGRWNCGELTGNYGKIGTAWAIAKKWEATEATETRPTSGFFVGLSRSHMLSHLGLSVEIRIFSVGWHLHPGISWDLNTSIPSTIITELLPRWSRIELTAETGGRSYDEYLQDEWSRAPGWLGYIDEILPSYIGIKVSHYKNTH